MRRFARCSPAALAGAALALALPGGATGAQDRDAPRLTGAKVTSKFAQGSPRARITLMPSERVSLTIVVVRAVDGRIVRGGHVKVAARRGHVSLRFPARLSLRLQPGSYRLRIRARDAAGNVSRVAISNRFTVVAPSARAPVRPGTSAPQPASPDPAPDRHDPVIAAAGDIACDPADASFNGGEGVAGLCHQRHTADLLDDGDLAQVLALGDLQYEDGTLAAFTASFDPSWGRVKSLIRPAPGNHEYHAPGAAGYFDYFNGVGALTGPAGERGKGYYSFDVGAWHVVALNSNCADVPCLAGQPQEAWLRDDLRMHPAACTLAYFHHPRFSSGGKGADTTVQPLWQALYDSGADVVLSGHEHAYERFAPQTPIGTGDPAYGLRQFTVGTGGKNHDTLPAAGLPNSEVRGEPTTFGVLRLTLHPGGYDWRFVPEAGQTFEDAGTAGCHGPPGT